MEHGMVVEVGGKKAREPKPTLFLDAEVIEGFDRLEVGQPIRLEVRGTLVGKRDPDEKSSSRFAELQVDSARVLGRVTDREARHMSSDELDEEVEQEFDSRMKSRST